MRYLGIDLETYSDVDLGKCGVYRYAQSEEFEILLLAYAWDDEPVQVIDLTAGEKFPPDVRTALTDPQIVKTAWNAAFERTCLARYFGTAMPPEQWEDTMITASVCGLPMHLGDACAALGLPEDQAKDRAGKALIRWFCKPCKSTALHPEMTRHLPQDWPEKWAQFVSYNGQDVVAERTIRKRLADWTPTGAEREIWRVDQGINDRGVRVDLTLARQAVTMDGTYKGELTAQAVALTGLENPNSVAQVKAWLAEQEGQEFPSLNKKAVADVVARLTLENTKQFLALRSELAKSSTKKYDAILRAACRDEHVRGCFQFCGAGRTGRWAGRLVQLQNLAKNKMEDLSSCRALVRAGDLDGLKLLYGNVTGCLSELIRTALIPEQGHRFLVCDYSAIEARVLSWIAGEEWALEEFRGDGLIYEATGARMFGVPKLSIAKGGENHHLRPAAKTAELACGYGGGMGAMKAFGADKMGMSDEDILRAVDLWREAHPNVRKLWKSLERAAIRCVVQGTPQVSETGKIRFDLERGILWMTLPSGRRIAYFGARYGEGTGPYTKGKKVLSYMGVDQQSHKWTRVETFSGKLTENLVQATARDCLRDAMIALDAAGFDIRAHIHDEVIISEPIGGRGVPDVAEIMGRTPSWAPGLPLRGDGYACDFYMKD